MDRQSKAFLYIVAVVGSVLAIPIALFTTCTARGNGRAGPDDHTGIGYGMGSLMIGCGAGLMLTIGLIVAAVKLRPGKGDKPPEDKQ